LRSLPQLRDPNNRAEKRKNRQIPINPGIPMIDCFRRCGRIAFVMIV
jgi:hypothetical protein